MAGCPGWNSINPYCRAKQLVSGAASDVFSSIAHSFGKAAEAAVTWLWSQIDQATAINLSSAGIKTDLAATAAIAGLLAFGLFLVQLIAAALRQDAGGLGRAVRGLGVAFVGAAFAIAATQLLLAAVDSLSAGVVRFALGTNVSGMGGKLVAATALDGINNSAGLLLMSLVLLAAVLIIWGALMIRKLLIIVSAVFAPLAFAGATADISRSWVRRWVEFTVALVFSKLILVIIFLIGLSVLNGAGKTTAGGAAGATQSVTNLAVGALTLLLAGFAPWIAIKTVHFAGDSFQHVHAQAAAAQAGAQTVIAAPQKIQSTMSRAQSMGSGYPAGASHGGAAARPVADSVGQEKALLGGKANTPNSKGFATEAAVRRAGAFGSAGTAVAGPGGPVAAAGGVPVAAAGAVKNATTNAVTAASDLNRDRPEGLPTGKNYSANSKGFTPRQQPGPPTPRPATSN